TVSRGATSSGLRLTWIFTDTTGRSPLRVRPYLRPPPCSLRRHYPDQVRGVPGRTRFSGILPPRRRGEVYTLRAARVSAPTVTRGCCVWRGCVQRTEAEYSPP